MMDDRISDLPDAVLCHILSFLSTKQSVATSLLSKRWKPLWRSVPTFHFYDWCFNHNYDLLKSVDAFMLSRDLDTFLQRFILHCWSLDPLNVKQWLAAAAQRGVEYVDLDLYRAIDLTSAVLRCKTLVVLKLSNIHLSFKPSSADFPVLKNLYLRCVRFSKYRDLAELLSGIPTVEDLEVAHLYFDSDVCEEKFKPLSKLVRADIVTGQFPLEIVCNVKDLRIDLIKHGCLIPEFQNLTSLKFFCRLKGLNVLDFIKHSPKLQFLVIYYVNMLTKEYGDEVYPPYVPKCISSHLKTCTFYYYYGSESEFRFARYVMQNARHLLTMKIRSIEWSGSEGKTYDMFKKLYSCSRNSTTCKLLFEKL